MSAPSPATFNFRVHFDDGSKVDIEAETKQIAGKLATAACVATQSKVVTKIKQVRS